MNETRLARGRITEGPVFDFFERSVHPGYELHYSWREWWKPPFEFHALAWRAVINGSEYHMWFDVPLPASIDQLMVVAERVGEHAQQHWEIMQMTPEHREQLRQMCLSPHDDGSTAPTIIPTGTARYKRAEVIEFIAIQDGCRDDVLGLAIEAAKGLDELTDGTDENAKLCPSCGHWYDSSLGPCPDCK